MYIFQPERYLLKQQVKKYSHYIKGRVLDVGAGEFSRYQDLFKCDEYIKMDIKKSDNVDVVGSAESIPFQDETFDSVVCTQVFEHLKNPQKAAAEISRVLKKGGICLLTVPQVNELHAEPNDYFRYTKFGLKEIFSQVGLDVLECSQRGGFFTLLAQLKIRYCIDRFNLYQRNWLGRLVSKLFSLAGQVMMFLDKIDHSQANRRHTLGWCLVLRKKSKDT